MTASTQQNPAWPATLFRCAAVLVLYALLLLLLSPPGAAGTWLAASAVLAVVLALLSAIDMQTFRLPDLLTLPLIAGGLLLAALFADGSLVWRAGSAAAAFAILALIAAAYERLRGHAGLGLGDAKLFAAAGAWLGAQHLANVMLAASVAALAWVAIKALAAGSLHTRQRLAFGPFIAGGFWLLWVINGPP